MTWASEGSPYFLILQESFTPVGGGSRLYSFSKLLGLLCSNKERKEKKTNIFFGYLWF